MNNTIAVTGKSKVLAEVHPHLELDILTGDKAFDLLADPLFLEKWGNLYNDCLWGTVFQSKEFVIPWYRVYSSELLPIIIKAESEGNLVGLLTLTTTKAKGGVIMAAGLGYAEYQTWLATPSFGEMFIQKALFQLANLYPRLDINFYNTPPDTPLNWINKVEHWQQRCIIKPLKRPLMDLKDPAVSKLFRKKQFREKMNRLKRQGDVEFKKITDSQLFASILDELTEQSDFRKAARYNTIEFRNDPRRKQFLLDIHSIGLLHATALILNGEIIALIAAATGKNWVHLAGINTHSPIFSKYSPGLINFLLLGQLLMEEGLLMFDLTPGGDAYKERLATSHDQVHDLYISNKLKTYTNKQIINPILKLVKSHLIRRGFVPRMLKMEAIKFKNRLALAKQRKGDGMFSWHYLRTGAPVQLTISNITFSNPLIYAVEPVKMNNISDLLDYDQSQGLQIKWDFLEDAMCRFEEGSQCYTLAEKGTLLFCAWHSTNLTYNYTGLSFPKDAIVLHGLYCHTNAPNRLRNFLTSTVAQIIYKQDSTLTLCCIVDAKDKDLSHALNKINGE